MISPQKNTISDYPSVQFPFEMVSKNVLLAIFLFLFQKCAIVTMAVYVG